MLLSDTFRIAIRGVTAQKSRSLLTTLGIIIGVGSVVLMTSIGASVEGLILGQVSSLGAQSMVVFPGTDEGSPANFLQDSLTFDDVEALERLTTIRTLAPVILLSGKVTAGREESNAEVLGTIPEFFENQNISIDRGRLIDEADERGAYTIAVLGPDAATDLFGDADPLGGRIEIQGRAFTVVGVLQALGSQFFQNVDKRVYLPFSSAKALTGQRHVNFMTMRATESVDLAFADVESLLRARHRIKNPDGDPDKDDFTVRSAVQATEILGTVSLAFTVFLTAIAGISLIVGGIGIMNIMLVAVTERTREIGLRKALGARGRDILRQFLFEAVLLTAIGGVIGLLSGLSLAFIGALIAQRFLSAYVFVISLPSVILAIVLAVVTGLVFGVMPARRAAGLNPIDALRYE